MQAFLIDAYRVNNSIVLWLKTERNFFVVNPYSAFLYLDDCPRARQAVKQLAFTPLRKKQYDGTMRNVLRVPAPLDGYEQFVLHLEELTRFRVPLFDADIPPEQLYLYENRLVPCTAVEIEGETIVASNLDAQIPFTEIKIQVFPGAVRSFSVPIKAIRVSDRMFTGDEKTLLSDFATYFANADPDIVSMPRAYLCLPYLAFRMEQHGIICPFHRWHPTPIVYRGGRSYWSYGIVRYQDYAVRLHGRLLLDKSTTVGSACDVDAIVELCRLSGNRFQQLASRSFGAVFQSNLVRELVLDKVLVPFKEKPLEPPLSLVALHDSDRAGHTYDPLLGFHTHVAEIDFASMYPHLIYNHNISADTLLSSSGPFENVPGTHIRVSLSHKGYTPRALKGLLDRRMWYKRNPSAVSKKRAAGLKWVLVSCYGYLRFREFKLGLPSAHMAICAYARKHLLDSAALAEERGFKVVHGIIDALYLRKDCSTDEVIALCRDVELQSGIPISFEGMFKWIVFLPSVNDVLRPVPTRYFGVFVSGELKVRGIELRQHSVCSYVKKFQKTCLEKMSAYSSVAELKALFPSLCGLLRAAIAGLASARVEELTCSVRISKLVYSKDCPQRSIVRQLQKKNIDLHAGMTVQYVCATSGAVLPEDYNGNVDVAEYTKKLVRALFVLIMTFGFTMDDIEANIGKERQERLVNNYLLTQAEKH